MGLPPKTMFKVLQILIKRTLNSKIGPDGFANSNFFSSKVDPKNLKDK